MPTPPRPRAGYQLKGKTRTELVELPPEVIAEENARRAPTDQLKTNFCGARGNPAQALRPCSKAAGAGTSHPGFGYCSAHGGNTPAGKKSAARAAGRAFIDLQKARMTKFGGDPSTVTISEEEALLEEVRRSVAMVRFLEDKIGQWTTTDLQATPNAELGGLPALVAETFKGTATTTDAAAWLVLYREERVHAARTAKMAIDAGLQTRLVRIAEDQGRMLATAVRSVLDALNLSPEQASLVPQVVPAILRQVSRGDLPASQDVIEGEVTP